MLIRAERHELIRRSIVRGLLLLVLSLSTGPVFAVTWVSTSDQNSSGTSLTVDKPDDVEVDDVMIAQIAVRAGSGATFTAPSGWSLIRRTNGSDIVQAVYYRTAESTAAASYTWNFSSAGRTKGIISAYRDVDPNDPVDVSSGNTGSSSTVTANSVTTNVDNGFLLALFTQIGGPSGFGTPPAGMTSRYDDGTGGQAATRIRAMYADQPLGDMGATGDRTVTSSNAAWVAQLVALRPRPPGLAEVTLRANGSTDPITVQPGDAITLDATVTDCTTGDGIGPYYDTWRQDADNLLDPEEFTDSPCDRTQPITFPDNPLVINTEGVYTIRFITGYDDADAEDTLEDGRDALQITVGDPADDPDDPFRLPDCAEAFGDAHLNVHDGEQGNLNLRDGSRVFNSSGVGANDSGPSRLQQQGGTYCIADDDPTDPSPGACDTFGSVRSWEEAGREFPEPPSSSYPGTLGDLNVADGQTITITTTDGSPQHYNQITIQDGGHLIIEGDGEVTSSSRFMGNPGASLTMNGTPIVNVDSRFEFGGSGTRSFMTINGEIATSVDTFARNNIILSNTDVEVTAGTWRPMTTSQGGDINVTAGSNLNCDPTHTPGAGWQPSGVMPDCQNDTGGIFMVSRSTGSIIDSAVRAFIYVDGTQYNVRRSLIKGSLTSGGNTLRESDFVPDGIPTTGGFCEERIDAIDVDIGAGNASTCRRRGVTITALDRFGQQLYTYRDTMELQTSSNHGDWFRVDEDNNPGDPEATNTPFDTGNDDGFGKYTFDEDDLGQVELFLENIHADDLRITATDTIENVSGTSDVLSFRDNAFVIDSVDDFDADVIAGRDHDFRATLWQREEGDDGEGCFIPDSYNNTSQAVRLWIDRDGDDPNGAAPEATAAGTGSTATLGDADPGAANINLDFSAANGDAGRALFTLSTTDVGKYAFMMAEDASGFAVDENDDARTITGGSENYVVRPFGFDIQVADVEEASDETGPVFEVAGAPFSFTIRAVQYLPAADTDEDGTPDGYAGEGDEDVENRIDLATAATTPSFGLEGIAGAAAVEAGLFAPGGGANPGLGDFAGTVGSAAFSDSGNSAAGEATVEDVHFNEVGIILLNAEHGNYLGSGRTIVGGTRSTVGRFIPDEFRLDSDGITNRTDLTDLGITCTSTFTYMDEPFTAEFTLSAYSRQDTVTTNYDEGLGFARMDMDQSGFNIAAYDDDADDADNPIGELIVDEIEAEWELGEAAGALVTLNVPRLCDDAGVDCVSDPDRNWWYETLRIGTNPVDQDDVQLASFDLPEVSTDGDHAEVGVTDIRFGRLVLDNVAGSELAPLQLPMRLEYWDGSTWRVNEADSCTVVAFDDSSELTLQADGGATSDGTAAVSLASGGETGVDTDDDAVDGDGIPFANGQTVIPLTAPGEGSTGWVEVILNLGSRWSYLRDNLTENDDWVDSPAGRATFGIREGADGRIIIQEVDPG